MNTLVIGDVHLCTTGNREDIAICRWLSHLVAQNDIEHIILNGDTFEIAFCMADRPELTSEQDILERILNIHRSFFEVLRGAARRITFVVGEHDYLIKEVLRDALVRYFAGHTVDVVEHFHHEPSRSLVVHGHQFDYNLVHDYQATEILTDELTRVFEDFTFQSEALTKRVMGAFEQQRFSFWYSAGRLPDFIDATCAMFGHDENVYYRRLADVLRSRYFRRWVLQLRNRFNKVIGLGVIPLAFLPYRAMKYLNRLWWAVAKTIVLRRAKVYLQGGRIPSLLDVPADLPIDNIVLGHAHQCRRLDFMLGGEPKTYVNTVSPRWHVFGLEAGQLRLNLDQGFAVLGDDGKFEYFGSQQSKTVQALEVLEDCAEGELLPAVAINGTRLGWS